MNDLISIKELIPSLTQEEIERTLVIPSHLEGMVQKICGSISQDVYQWMVDPNEYNMPEIDQALLKCLRKSKNGSEFNQQVLSKNLHNSEIYALFSQHCYQKNTDVNAWGSAKRVFLEIVLKATPKEKEEWRLVGSSVISGTRVLEKKQEDMQGWVIKTAPPILEKRSSFFPPLFPIHSLSSLRFRPAVANKARDIIENENLCHLKVVEKYLVPFPEKLIRISKGSNEPHFFVLCEKVACAQNNFLDSLKMMIKKNQKDRVQQIIEQLFLLVKKIGFLDLNSTNITFFKEKVILFDTEPAYNLEKATQTSVRKCFFSSIYFLICDLKKTLVNDKEPPDYVNGDLEKIQIEWKEDLKWNQEFVHLFTESLSREMVLSVSPVESIKSSVNLLQFETKSDLFQFVEGKNREHDLSETVDESDIVQFQPSCSVPTHFTQLQLGQSKISTFSSSSSSSSSDLKKEMGFSSSHDFSEVFDMNSLSDSLSSISLDSKRDREWLKNSEEEEIPRKRQKTEVDV